MLSCGEQLSEHAMPAVIVGRAKKLHRGVSTVSQVSSRGTFAWTLKFRLSQAVSVIVGRCVLGSVLRGRECRVYKIHFMVCFPSCLFSFSFRFISFFLSFFLSGLQSYHGTFIVGSSEGGAECLVSVVVYRAVQYSTVAKQSVHPSASFFFLTFWGGSVPLLYTVYVIPGTFFALVGTILFLLTTVS